MLSTHSIANECTCRLRTFAHNTGTPRLLQYCQLYCNRISLVCRALGATAVPIPGQGTVACCLLGAAAHTQNCSSSCPSARDPYLRAPGQAPHVQRPTPNAMRPALRATRPAAPPRAPRPSRPSRPAPGAQPSQCRAPRTLLAHRTNATVALQYRA